MSKETGTYRYLRWEKDTPVEEIMEEVTELSKDGWKIISHSQTVHGMSIIFSRLRLDKLK